MAASNAPGFPASLKGGVGSAVAVADLGGHGEMSVLAIAGGKVVAFDFQGHRVKGFAVDLGHAESPAGDVAAADMDGDGKAEIAVATASGKLFLISGGEVAQGFPIQLTEGAEAGPSFADLDGDGRPELLQGDSSGKLHAFKKTGAEMPGFPVELGEPLSSSASAGWLQGKPAIAVGGRRGSVFVLDAAGRPLPGFPAVTRAGVAAPPAFGDIDDDGKSDLIVASLDFHLYAWNEGGQALAGFPVTSGLSIHGSPAIADLDGDGILDVAFASTDGSLYAVKGTGEPIAGFPVVLGPALSGGVVVGDLKRDGTLALLTGGSDGRVFAITAKGKPVAGFPHRVGTGELATPALALSKAGTPVAFIGAPSGELAALQGPPSSAHVAAALPWPTAGRDAAHGGWFHPNPPRYKELTLPQANRTGDALAAQWRVVAVDGQPEPPFSVSWIRNGKSVKELDGQKSLPAFTARRGEHWAFEIHSGDRVFKSAEVAIHNTAPTAPVVRIEPQSPTRATGAKVVIEKPAEDADGDAPNYKVLWLLDGESTQVFADAIPGPRLTKGRRLTAVVTATDGTDESPTVSVESVVANTAPTAAVISLSPEAPKRGDTLSVRVAHPATDVDGDSLTLRYRWQLNGRPLNYALDVAALPLSGFAKGDRVAVSVAAFDGTVEGPPVSLDTQLANTPPTAPQIAIDPSHPRAGEALRVAVLGPASDIDGDRLSYDAHWSVDGRAAGEGLEMPGAKVKKGQKWTVSVQTSDGTALGPEAKASATIENTPPGAPEVSLCERPVRVGAPLEVRLISPAPDVDGDAVSYHYRWSVNGKPMTAWTDHQRVPDRQVSKHQLVQVTVIPTDGSAEGRSAAAECRVENTPPGAPTIALEPAQPFAGTGISVRVVTPAVDADGDAISYRYAWTVDGVSIPVNAAKIGPGTLRQGQRVRVAVTAFDGEAEGPAVEGSARVENTPPPEPEVAISPASPAVGEALHCLAQVPAKDIDGDALSVHRVWSRNGETVPAAAEREVLPQGWVRHGEKWTCEAWSDDGQATSAHVRKEVTGRNSKPSAPVVRMEKLDGAAANALRCAIVRDAVDPDGDAVTYRYSWARNGKAVPPGTDPSLSPVTPGHGESLTCAVSASDGTMEGPAASVSWNFVNSPPQGARISIQPQQPQPGQKLTCMLDQPAVDPDGDKVSYRVTWFKDGVAQSFPPNAVEVPGWVVHSGELWSCQAQPTDGQSDGPIARSSEVTVLPAPKQALR